jgi:hypothetical protein
MAVMQTASSTLMGIPVAIATPWQGSKPHGAGVLNPPKWAFYKENPSPIRENPWNFGDTLH